MSFIDDVLVSGHGAVIHFPIVAIIMSLIAALTALALGIFLDSLRASNKVDDDYEELILRFMERFEFLSFALVILGEVGLIIAAFTGIRSSGSLDSAINDELIEFKVRLSILLFFVMLTPIVQKSYFGISKRTHVFTGKSRVIPLLYIIPLMISVFLTILISSVGAEYNNKVNFFRELGLDWLLP